MSAGGIAFLGRGVERVERDPVACATSTSLAERWPADPLGVLVARDVTQHQEYRLQPIQGRGYIGGMWTIREHPEVTAWLEGLTGSTAEHVTAALERLRENGPGLGRPTVDTIKGSRHHNMKELRAKTARVLFVFDPQRQAILLVAGDKRGEWNRWYTKAVPLADDRYADWLEVR